MFGFDRYCLLFIVCMFIPGVREGGGMKEEGRGEVSFVWYWAF